MNVSDNGCVIKQEEYLCSDTDAFPEKEVSNMKECAMWCYNIPNCGTWNFYKPTRLCTYSDTTVDNDYHCASPWPGSVWGSRECGKEGITHKKNSNVKSEWYRFKPESTTYYIFYVALHI